MEIISFKFKVVLQKFNVSKLPFSSKATRSVKSSDGLDSPIFWCGGPKGKIDPPRKYKEGKSWYITKRAKGGKHQNSFKKGENRHDFNGYR